MKSKLFLSLSLLTAVFSMNATFENVLIPELNRAPVAASRATPSMANIITTSMFPGYNHMPTMCHKTAAQAAAQAATKAAVKAAIVKAAPFVGIYVAPVAALAYLHNREQAKQAAIEASKQAAIEASKQAAIEAAKQAAVKPSYAQRAKSMVVNAKSAVVKDRKSVV